MNNDYKEVRYDLYCKTCKHQKLKGFQEPCNECLDYPVQETIIPMNWEAKK